MDAAAAQFIAALGPVNTRIDVQAAVIMGALTDQCDVCGRDGAVTVMVQYAASMTAPDDKWITRYEHPVCAQSTIRFLDEHCPGTAIVVQVGRI